MVPALLPWIACWSQSLAGCDGSLLLFPEQVTYAVPYSLRGMLVSPACPPADDGTMQACATELSRGEWPTESATCLSSDAIPTPPIEQVYDFGMPIACNPVGCGCA